MDHRKFISTLWNYKQHRKKNMTFLMPYYTKECFYLPAPPPSSPPIWKLWRLWEHEKNYFFHQKKDIQAFSSISSEFIFLYFLLFPYLHGAGKKNKTRGWGDGSAFEHLLQRTTVLFPAHPSVGSQLPVTLVQRITCRTLLASEGTSTSAHMQKHIYTKLNIK